MFRVSKQNSLKSPPVTRKSNTQLYIRTGRDTMNVKVLYHSSTGNTKKVADAIADALMIKAEPISDADLSMPIDLLFIGDGVYFGKPSKETIAFIDKLTPDTVKNAAVFATYGRQSDIGEKIRKLLQDKQLNVVGEPFTCKGKAWVILHHSHPSEDDLSMAREYANAIVAQIKP